MLTLKDFTNHIGCGTVSQCLRAIDKYNLEHVWLVLEDNSVACYFGYHPEGWRGPRGDASLVDRYPGTTKIKKVGAGCIAWDGSDWEYSSERDARSVEDIDAVRQDCDDAHREYCIEWGEE